MNETPDFVALHPLALHVANVLVVVSERDLAGIAEQLINGVYGAADYPLD
jgi:hypothetical protein